MARRSPTSLRAASALALALAFTLTLTLTLTARMAGAAEPSGEKFPDAEPPLGVLPTPADALIDPKMARSWAVLPARPFVSTTVDFGFVYVRPRV